MSNPPAHRRPQSTQNTQSAHTIRSARSVAQHAGHAQPRRNRDKNKTPEPLQLTTSAQKRSPSPTLEINEAIAARRAAGHDVLHLGFGEATLPLHPKLREALAQAATQTGYAPVQGIPALRAAIADYLGRERGLTYDAEQIIVGPGSKPLLYALLQILDGDVLIPRPSWVSYAPHARLAGRQVIGVETDERDHHTLTPQALAAAFTRAQHNGANPRVLVVNTPSNPTGGMFSREDAEALADWAKHKGVTIVSDEIYAELAHGWRPHVSPAMFYPEGTIVTGGLSKGFAAGGWRLGYAALPRRESGKQLMAALRALASEVWSAASAPIQEAAVIAYTPDDDLRAYLRRSARLYGYVTNRLHAALERAGLRCARPAGAFYLYPDFTPLRAALVDQGVMTSVDLARRLLDRYDIATLPGVAFGERPETLRLRLATSMFFAQPSQTAEEREAALWSLLARADTLPEGDSDATPDLLDALPELARAEQRLAECIAELNRPHPQPPLP